MPWPELVIFDCDGVLVDSEVIALAQMRRALGEAGLAMNAAQTLDYCLGLRLETVLRNAETDLGTALPPTFGSNLAQEILARLDADVQGIAGVPQALARIDARVCVASSSAPDRIGRSLAMAGYASLFGPHVFSAHMVARGKPSPDLFLYAAQQMAVSPAQCLVIEDSLAGVLGAVAAGMPVFGFVGGGHFSDSPKQGERLTAAGAHLVFDKMQLLPDIIADYACLRAGQSTIA